MKIGINCGHTVEGPGCGAVGIIKESEHTRLVGQALMGLLHAGGVTVIDCTIDSAATQTEYLAAATALANREDLDWFISIHFNASGTHTGQGVEVYTYEGRQYPDALDVCNNIASIGFKNRGVKDGSGLYVIRKTRAKSMLIEVCFCDNAAEVALYNAAGGAETIARAIYCGIYTQAVLPDVSVEEDHNLTVAQFHDFVGEIAQMDWIDRKIMIPSVVIAQAAIESAKGTSELAVNANALFGIKKNGWTGRTYIKDATEQNPGGSYRVEKLVEWRAYDSWKTSIIDHNTYLAGRSTDGGKTLQYALVVGCENYVLACQHLQECGYATSKTYAKTLINYIERNNLIRFDEVEEDNPAPEGCAYVVSAGIYKKSRANAEKLKKRLEGMGVIAEVILCEVKE